MDTPLHPDCYWVEPGRFLAGEYPGSPDPAAARAKLRALLACGIRAFVDLTEPDELLAYEHLLAEEAAARGVAVTYDRTPIRDLDIPSVDGMRAILDTIGRAVERECPVYVHCWGGVGRTGTVVACWLAERAPAGTDVFESLAELRADCAKRARSSPETAIQADFVLAWCRNR